MRYPLITSAAILAALPFAAAAQGWQVGCEPGAEAAPGTMTPLGYPCPVGAEPAIPGRNGPFPDEALLMPRPAWEKDAPGAAGVAASERAASLGEAPELSVQSAPVPVAHPENWEQLPPAQP